MILQNFALILLFLTVLSGAIWLADSLLFAKQRKLRTDDVKLPVVVDYAKSFFPVFLIVFLIRSFVMQLYLVPSGSLEPTVTPGDYVFVSQYSYGLRLPIWNKLLLKTGSPKRGDIAVFKWPVNHKINLIKRVIGLPGDKISYINKKLYINGKAITQTLLSKTRYGDTQAVQWPVDKIQENLLGVKHDIYVCPSSSTECPGRKAQNFRDLIVPKGEYFVMGDNRDDSDDSRFWGFVPSSALVGKAQFIIFSWNKNASWTHKIRWSRIGERL